MNMTKKIYCSSTRYHHNAKEWDILVIKSTRCGFKQWVSGAPLLFFLMFFSPLSFTTIVIIITIMCIHWWWPQHLITMLLQWKLDPPWWGLQWWVFEFKQLVIVAAIGCYCWCCLLLLLIRWMWERKGKKGEGACDRTKDPLLLVVFKKKINVSKGVLPIVPTTFSTF
jgi:hypothetical protein